MTWQNETYIRFRKFIKLTHLIFERESSVTCPYEEIQDQLLYIDTSQILAVWSTPEGGADVLSKDAGRFAVRESAARVMELVCSSPAENMAGEAIG